MSSFNRDCELFQAPVAARAQYDKLTWGHLREQSPQRGNRRRDSKEVLKPQLALLDAAEAERRPEGGDDIDTLETINGERERAPAEGGMDSDIPTHSLGKSALWKVFTRPPLRERKL